MAQDRRTAGEIAAQSKLAVPSVGNKHVGDLWKLKAWSKDYDYTDMPFLILELYNPDYSRYRPEMKILWLNDQTVEYRYYDEYDHPGRLELLGRLDTNC